jgi:uncharacterized membrane protein
MKDLLLTVHILSAAAWLGGGLFAMVSFPRQAAESGLKKLLALDEAIGSKFFGTAVGLLLLSGIGLVLDSDAFGWGDGFVLIGFGTIVVDGALEGAVFGPALKRIARAEPEDVGAFKRLFRRSGAVHVVLIVFAVWAMVAKLGV